MPIVNSMRRAVLVFSEGETWWYAVGSSGTYTGDSMGLRESDYDAIDAVLSNEWEWEGDDPGINILFLTKFVFTEDGIRTEECEYSRQQLIDWIRERAMEVHEEFGHSGDYTVTWKEGSRLEELTRGGK